jgi:vacuolar protein sorting-associated protein 35
MADSNLSSEEQQEKWLDEATAVVKQQAAYMKKALDQNSTREALKHASIMLCELRSGNLSPKNYYELYMLVFDELRHLEFYFHQEWKKGRKMVELYELVQHAGNILPRLYLISTVGSVYIKSKECPAKDILKDLVEMCRGVQHPMRGLFLRNFLLQLSKDKLPDIGSEYEGAGGSVRDSIEFILLNFAEMNKLWVRMQHQGPVKEREKREKERLDLRMLVGTNLVRLSQLEGVDSELYKTIVLPRIVEQVLNCKDQIAQQFLMECIIQVFPDELHLVTLEVLLNACTQLQPGVDVRGIMVALMDRLADFAKKSADLIPEDLNIFALFCSYVAKMTKGNTLDLAGILTLQVALLNFALGFAPAERDYVDQILGFATQTLQANNVKRVEDTVSTKAISQACTTLTHMHARTHAQKAHARTH